MSNPKKDLTISFVLISAALAAIFLTVMFAVPMTNLVGVDWWYHFQPATQTFLSGGDPYAVKGFYSPPWLLILLAPLTRLPLNVSIPIIFILDVVGYTWIAYRLRVNKYLILPFIVFSGAAMDALMANIDGLLLFGLLLPPWLGVILLMSKPQIGIPVLLFHALVMVSERVSLRNKLTYLIKFLSPLAVISLLSIVIYGDWYAHASETIDKSWNAAVAWPYGVPLGLALIGIGAFSRNGKWALMAIPFMSPYVSSKTWAIATMGFLALRPGYWLFYWLRDWYVSHCVVLRDVEFVGGGKTIATKIPAKDLSGDPIWAFLNKACLFLV